MKYLGIRSDCIDPVWGQVEPLIQGAIDHSRGELTTADVRDFLNQRIMQLWIGHKDKEIKMIAVTEIIEYPQFKAGRVVLGNTDGLETGWLDMLEIMERWAVEQGCHRMEAFVRKGLTKPMKAVGYLDKYVVTDKELNHAR